MQTLNENQVLHKAGQVSMIVGALHPDDAQRVFDRVLTRMGTPPVSKDTRAPDDTSLIREKLIGSLHSGLDSGNAQMARVTLDYLDKQAGKDYLSELTVNIIPYTVKDTSLTKIVSEASDEVVAEIETALLARRNRAA